MSLSTPPDQFQFRTNEWGQLVLTADGQNFVGVDLIRCFPLSDPDHLISVLDASGSELTLLDHLDQLSESARTVVQAALAEREFVPVIQEIQSTSAPVPPCQWTIDTDRGPTRIQLDSDDDLRRLTPERILVVDTNGLRYLIPSIQNLNPHSRTILRRYL
ncbi:MAG TPA: DUF1854 domain-containing protein [Planctomycetaceae bacterium]|nr:DUF1854 domain-containing protein [Planctomycetaceae bacterium]